MGSSHTALLLLSVLFAVERTRVESFPRCPRPILSHIILLETKCAYEVGGILGPKEFSLTFCKETFGPRAELTSVVSAEEHQILSKDLMRPSWLGLSLSTIETDKEWDDGTPYNFTRWAPGEPSVGHDCAVIDPYKQLWYAKDCARVHGIVCSLPIGQEWKVYNDYEYHLTSKILPFGITWGEARDACLYMGADLLSVTSHEEREQLNNWLEEFDGDLMRRYWIGLQLIDQPSSSDSWSWSDGSIANVTYWNTTYPRLVEEGARCAYAEGFVEPDGMWFNTNCGIRQGAYICKRPKGSEGAPITDEPPIDVTTYCPAGYTDLDGLCVKVFKDDVKTWHEAMEVCRSGPGKDPALVSITSALISAMVSSLIVPGVSDLWIGGYRYGDDGGGWSNGAKYDYKNFAVSWDESQDKNCLGIGRPDAPHGEWTPDDCNDKKAFICQTNKDPENPIPTPEPQPPGCPPGFDLYNTHCYKISEDKMSWLNASKSCEDASPQAELVTIEHAAENFYVLSHLYWILLNIHPDTRLWLGLQDRNADNTYKWVDGTPLDYTSWARGQPRRAVNGGCVAMARGSTWPLVDIGIWLDKNCSAPYFYMCRAPQSTELALLWH